MGLDAHHSVPLNSWQYADPENNTLIIQVLVTPRRIRGTPADTGAVARLPEEARIVTVKTRKAS